MVDELSGTGSLFSHVKEIKSNLFTGRATVVGSANQRWYLYFHLGRLLYATGGHHAMRRWLRHLSLNFPTSVINPYETESIKKFTDISHLSEFEIFSAWEYFLLRDYVQNQQLTREVAIKMAQGVVLEVLFDIQQAEARITETNAQTQLNSQLALFDAEQLWAAASQSWRQWQRTRLAAIYPDRAAKITRSARLRQEMSAAAYEALASLLDGQRSLREISAQTGRSTLVVANSLLVYLESGNIILVEVPDLIDPAERFYSQSGNLLSSPLGFGDAPRAQNFAQRARVAR
jgi:two-component system, chemotaxis family, response regulator PixG